VVPAQQRLEPGDPLGRGLHHGLVNISAAMGERIAQVFFQLAAFLASLCRSAA
jgi:hypothetical protein